MKPMDLIRDKFSQNRSIETVLHLVMAHFDLSEEDAQTEIDEYFEIVAGTKPYFRRSAKGLTTWAPR